MFSYTPPKYLPFEDKLDNALKSVFCNSGLYFIDIKQIFTIDNLNTFIYEKNRPIDEEKVIQISIYEKKYKEKYGSYDFHLSKINLATVNNDDLKIIDGQHRIKSALLLEGEVNCDIVITNYTCEEDRFNSYLTINKNTPVDEFYKTPNEAYVYIIKLVAQQLKINYPSAFSQYRTPFRPKIHIDVLCEHLYAHFILDKNKHLLNVQDIQASVNTIFSAIVALNKKLIDNDDVTQFPKYNSTVEMRQKVYDITYNMDFVLGMYSKYEWVSRLFRKKLVLKKIN
jgi:hypothetical protein